jgi:hypothetical protein
MVILQGLPQVLRQQPLEVKRVVQQVWNRLVLHHHHKREENHHYRQKEEKLRHRQEVRLHLNLKLLE